MSTRPDLASGPSSVARARSLTVPAPETTIAAMQRETLLAILGTVPGLRKDGARYLVQDGLEIAVYVGQPGRAAALEHVLGVGVPETPHEVEVRDSGTL